MYMQMSPGRISKANKINEAREVSARELELEEQKAYALCKEEEDTSDAEWIEDSDDEESEETEESYDSDFIDDSELDQDEVKRARVELEKIKTLHNYPRRSLRTTSYH